MNTQSAVVLAAGSGSRMRSNTPKAIHRVCGREMLNLVLDAAKLDCISNRLAVVPKSNERIINAIDSDIDWVEQITPMGTGDALLQAADALVEQDHLLVLPGDAPLVTSDTLAKLVSHHISTKAHVTLLSGRVSDPADLGRVSRDPEGRINRIVEYQDDVDRLPGEIEINSGIYCFRADWMWPRLRAISPSGNGEIRLTDLVGIAYNEGILIESIHPCQIEDILGVNDLVQLAQANQIMRNRVLDLLMRSGVIIEDPASVHVDVGVSINQDTVLKHNSYVSGDTTIGQGCQIGPNATIEDSLIGDHSVIFDSLVSGSILHEDVRVGPYSHIRPGCQLETTVRIGSHVEINRSHLGSGTKVTHFSYLGDSEVGENVNIGAGTVTCNFDGDKKSRTILDDGVFVGAGSLLIAPIKIGQGASTGAGAVVTHDVPPNTLVTGIPAREVDKGKIVHKIDNEGIVIDHTLKHDDDNFGN